MMKTEVQKKERFSLSSLAIPASFMLVLIIWTTTPLAIKWSSAGAPMTSALLRMLIGVTFCGSIVIFMSSKFRVDAAARKVYLVGGLSIFVCMSLFYAAAQQIPSGWIAVLFGLSPLFTGLFSAMVEPDTKLTLARLFGLLLGLAGLYLVFSAGLNFADASIEGVILTLVAVVISSATSVISRQLVKDLELPGMQITTGSLIVAIPCFIVAVLLLEPQINLMFTSKAWSAILYLGLIGTGVGFTLYYYLLKHISASRIALITLITPISALSVGSWLNKEPLVPEVWMGATLVCIGLLLYEFKPRLGLRKL
ncbi:MAG: drug/metabolite transporter (DMT)-like permease [Arenicella sp.]|jgi:drug/metabolite transporter (DMT)-like permease